jgi:hypothetical protein
MSVYSFEKGTKYLISGEPRANRRNNTNRKANNLRPNNNGIFASHPVVSAIYSKRVYPSGNMPINGPYTATYLFENIIDKNTGENVADSLNVVINHTSNTDTYESPVTNIQSTGPPKPRNFIERPASPLMRRPEAPPKINRKGGGTRSRKSKRSSQRRTLRN